MQRIITDFENNSEVFWNNINQQKATNSLAAIICHQDEFWATDKEAENIKAFVESIEGWNDPSQPKHAKHPIMFLELEDDDFRIEGISVRVGHVAEDEAVLCLDDPEDNPDKEIVLKKLISLSGREWKIGEWSVVDPGDVVSFASIVEEF